MADGPEVLIEQTLNDVLTRLNETQDKSKELQRDLNAVSARLTELGREAQGLRLALFALAGGTDLDQAEANRQNAKQQQELRRART